MPKIISSHLADLLHCPSLLLTAALHHILAQIPATKRPERPPEISMETFRNSLAKPLPHGSFHVPPRCNRLGDLLHSRMQVAQMMRHPASRMHRSPRRALASRMDQVAPSEETSCQNAGRPRREHLPRRRHQSPRQGDLLHSRMHIAQMMRHLASRMHQSPLRTPLTRRRHQVATADTHLLPNRLRRVPRANFQLSSGDQDIPTDRFDRKEHLCQNRHPAGVITASTAGSLLAGIHTRSRRTPKSDLLGLQPKSPQ
ncbi:hypothetical protein O6P43_023668 [Quillaja saponaria]|uniref:Uncharacterized protein n=1 Tax=Quillaja saponaria TaxID=32244 RepID=A0AAD7LFN7_QUISA|nr:hypothetical protein O6P43_023668 [Quillaja saponaria]